MIHPSRPAMPRLDPLAFERAYDALADEAIARYTLDELRALSPSDLVELDLRIWHQLIGRMTNVDLRLPRLRRGIESRVVALEVDLARPRVTFDLGSLGHRSWYRDANWQREPFPKPCPQCGTGELKVYHDLAHDDWWLCCLNSACAMEWPEAIS